MGLVTVERRGGTAVMTYANPPLGTMTAAGAQEMLEAFRPLSADPAVRSVVITGGLPDIFIRHYDVGELSAASDATEGVAAPEPPPSTQPGGRPRPAVVIVTSAQASFLGGVRRDSKAR